MALFTVPELAAWIQSADPLDTATAVLARDQATAYLEAETGVRLTRQEDIEITYTPRWDDCWVDLPVPTVTVTSVAVDGVTLGSTDYQFVKDSHRLYRSVGWGGSRWNTDLFDGPYRLETDFASVDVVCTFGYADGAVPAEFKTWGLVLASQVYLLAAKVGLQSVRIDDYSETYATSGTQPFTAMALPPQVLGQLKARYGRGASVVAAR